MEEANKVILNDNKFKKINGNNKGGAFCTNYAYDRVIHVKTNIRVD